MPIYEYKCEKCGTFEVLQAVSEEPLKTCPKCGGPVKKLIGHNVGVIYKCGGFYAADHRSSEYKEKAKEDTKAATT